MQLHTLPALGQPLEGGTFAGITTLPDGTHHAIVLLDDKPGQRLTWPQAVDWAASVNATLPSRPVAALLFANLRDRFEAVWHWTCEAHKANGSYAWVQYFDYGYQSITHKSSEGRARAVRLIQLVS